VGLIEQVCDCIGYCVSAKQDTYLAVLHQSRGEEALYCSPDDGHDDARNMLRHNKYIIFSASGWLFIHLHDFKPIFYEDPGMEFGRRIFPILSERFFNTYCSCTLLSSGKATIDHSTF
jgi:hypothetical protein